MKHYLHLDTVSGSSGRETTRHCVCKWRTAAGMNRHAGNDLLRKEVIVATASIHSEWKEACRHRLGVRRLVVAAGLTAAAVFALCWIGLFVPFLSLTHGYVGLFTDAEPKSAMALAEGALWSLFFGALVGGLFALTYNATSSMGDR